MDEIRRHGYALNWEESAEGVCAVPVALRDTAGAGMTAVGIAAPSSRMGGMEAIQAFAPELRSVTERISAQLGDPS